MALKLKDKFVQAPVELTPVPDVRGTRGRYKDKNIKRDRVIAFRVSKSTEKKLQDEANLRKITTSTLIELIIQDYWKRNP
jgi:hypothetical protein